MIPSFGFGEVDCVDARTRFSFAQDRGAARTLFSQGLADFFEPR
jgi:hypothetical protein